MATLEELKQEIMNETPRLPNRGFGLGVGNARVRPDDTTGRMMVEAEGNEPESYEAWLKKLNPIEIRILAQRIVEYNREREAEAQQQTQAAPPPPPPPSQPEAFEVALTPPNMRRDLTEVTLTRAKKEVEGMVREGRPLPDYLEVLKRLEPGSDAAVAAEHLFTDPGEPDVAKKDRSKRSTPIYRGFKNPDGSVTEGKLFVHHPDGSEEPFEEYLNKQPDALVRPLLQEMYKLERGPVVPAPSVETGDGAPGPGPSSPPSAPPPRVPSAPADDEPVQLHNYAKIFHDTVEGGRTKGRYGFSLGAGLAAVAGLALVGVAPINIVFLAPFAAMFARPLGEVLGARSSREEAFENVAQMLTVDLAKMSAEKRGNVIDGVERQFTHAGSRAGVYDEEVAKLGARAVKDYFAKNRSRILEAADKLSQTPGVVDAVEGMLEQKAAVRAKVIDQTENTYRNRTGMALGLGIMGGLMAPGLIATGTVGLLTGAGSVLGGAFAGSVIGGALGLTAGNRIGEARGEEAGNQRIAHQLADMQPEYRAKSLEGLKIVVPGYQYDQIVAETNTLLATPQRGPAQGRGPARGQGQDAPEPEPVPRPSTTSERDIVARYAETVGNVSVKSALLKLGTSRFLDYDMLEIEGHLNHQAREGKPVPNEVLQAMDTLYRQGQAEQAPVPQAPSGLGAVEAEVRAQGQAQTRGTRGRT
jgi:hypothetical protein